MMPIVVWSLLVVVMSDGGSTAFARQFATEPMCETAAAAAHEAAKTAIGVLDVGTLCVRSSFSPLVKPRA